MRATIGELVRYILPYANILEISSVNNIPFMKCVISGKTRMGKAYVYIIQVDEHKYSVCDNCDDLLGEKYFPTGNIARPFIKEKDLANELTSNRERDACKYDRVRNDLTVSGFISYFNDILLHYNTIRFDVKNYDIKISAMGFHNQKIRKALDKSFKEYDMTGTIRDLFEVVNIRGCNLTLSKLREADMEYIRMKLSDLGVDITVKADSITDVRFERSI